MIREINPKFDLVLERFVDVPANLVWKAWTEPEHMVKWFCPRPWKATECKVELFPSGAFNIVMESPDGEKFPNNGCILEVESNKKLTWTSVLHKGFRPANSPENPPDMPFTATLLLETENGGTKYTAIATHPNEEVCKKHDEMGFTDGWGTCLDQLVEEIKKGNIK